MASNIPVIVQGNSFSLAIPLQIYVIQDGEMVLQDYTPDPTDDVSIQLKGTRRNYTYTPSMAGNIATIELSGNELADNYAVVVSIVKANGQRLRSFRTDQFFIVESSDDLTVDDIVQGLEENVIYLNAQAFISLGGVVISDSTTTFDANSALSAKQGVILRQNIELLLSSLGEYAFPDGKPTLEWSGGTLAVTLNLTDFSSSNMAETTQRGSAYTTTLIPAHSSNLYVNDVVIMMGDEDITATAYNESTGVVSIAEVTGAIEITASQETYVQDGLVLHLDGKNRGGTAGHWISLVDYNGAPIDFTLTNCDETHDSYVAGNGTTSKGIGSVDTLDVSPTAGTIEALYDGAEWKNDTLMILHNRGSSTVNHIGLASWHYDIYDSDNLLTIAMGANVAASSKVAARYQKTTIIGGGLVSCLYNSFLINDTEPVAGSYDGSTYLADSTSMLSIFYHKISADERYFKLNLYSIRVYNRHLTDAERAQNKRVDEKRFNLI